VFKPAMCFTFSHTSRVPCMCLAAGRDVRLGKTPASQPGVDKILTSIKQRTNLHPSLVTSQSELSAEDSGTLHRSLIHHLGYYLSASLRLLGHLLKRRQP
jgi:hypothetical protein